MIRRYLFEGIKLSLEQRRGVALLGARQTGKSTLARQLLDAGTLKTIISLDEEASRQAALQDPTGFVNALPVGTAIDEVQRAPDLMLAIKHRLDRDSSPGQFLLTGSADLLTAPMIHDSLPGRLAYFNLWPFSQGEILGVRENFLDRATDGDLPTLTDQPIGRSAYAETVTCGGYPEAQDLDPRERSRFFSDYLASALGRELPETSSIRKLEAVERVLGLVAARSGGITNFAGIGRDAGVSADTARTHTKALEMLFLVKEIPAWHTNLNTQFIKSPKIHITDSGLLAHLLGVDATQISDPTNDAHAGQLFESFVVMELTRQSGWAERDFDFHHYRDSSHREVDIVATTRSGDVVGIEVKAGATVRSKDFNSLALLRDKLGARFKQGIILYTGERSLPFGERLAAHPVSALWRR